MDQEIEDIILGHEDRRPEGSLNRRIAAALSVARGSPGPAYQSAGMDEKQPSAEAMEAALGWLKQDYLADNFDTTDTRLARLLDAFAARSRWRPISEAPEGEHVMLWFPKGERGRGGVECGTFWRDPDGSIECFWTHGGPNSGGDWTGRSGEQPTHWQQLPEPPSCL